MKPRRWFRFSLRTFFVLVTLLGVWLGVQFKWIHDRREALRWLIDLPPVRANIFLTGQKAPWSIRILGANGVGRIEMHLESPHEDGQFSVAKLKALFPEAEVTPPNSRANQP